MMAITLGSSYIPTVRVRRPPKEVIAKSKLHGEGKVWHLDGMEGGVQLNDP